MTQRPSDYRMRKLIFLKGLDEAVTHRVHKMFDVLMAESSPPNEAFDRFEAGLGKLIVTWRKAEQLILEELIDE